MYKDKIHAILAKKTNAKPGEPAWLKHHPAAVTKVMNGLNEEEMDAVEATRDEWNNEGPEQEEKQRYVIVSHGTLSKALTDIPEMQKTI